LCQAGGDEFSRTADRGDPKRLPDRRGDPGAAAELADYADRKLDLCPYGPEKPTCSNCPIHCYRTEPRERMREIMRYSGPRMLKNHPYLAIMHIFDGKREPAPLPKKERPG
jgi:hypothetical protein